MAKPTPTFHLGRRQLVLLALAVIAVYILLPQFGDFRSSWHMLEHPDPFWMAIAILLMATTFVLAAGTYYFLAFKPLFLRQMVLVQLAATFINRLLPAGIGALGANYLYLRHEKHKASQAGSIVVINNLLGFSGHSLVVLVTLLTIPGQALSVAGTHGSSLWLLIKAASVIVVALTLLIALFGRKKVADTAHDVKKQLLSYRQRPLSLVAALTTSTLLTICNVLCLACCLLALGLHLPFAAVLLVFTFGLGAGSAIPTPGGLGGFEAGLAAGLVAYDVSAPLALGGALLYRLVSYWLPLLAGGLAFIVCQRGRLFET